MESHLVIREALRDDLGTVAHIHVQSWKESYVGQVPQAYLDGLDVEARKQKWQAIMDEPTFADRQHLYLACLNQKPVGFASLGYGRDPDKREWGEIYAIYLLREAWGKGGGHSLFLKARSAFQEKNIRSFYAWVLDTNHTAIRAYTRWGGILNPIPKVIEISGQTVNEVAVEFT